MITFKKTGKSDLTIKNGRILPAKDSIQINQIKTLTSGNNPIVVDYSNSKKIYKLVLKNLSKDEFSGSINGIKTWFKSPEINWMMNSFTMILTDGTQKIVRLWNNKFDMNMKPNFRYDLIIELREE